MKPSLRHKGVIRAHKFNSSVIRIKLISLPKLEKTKSNKPSLVLPMPKGSWREKECMKTRGCRHRHPLQAAFMSTNISQAYHLHSVNQPGCTLRKYEIHYPGRYQPIPQVLRVYIQLTTKLHNLKFLKPGPRHLDLKVPTYSIRVSFTLS